jgi:hypothetical protein
MFVGHGFPFCYCPKQARNVTRDTVRVNRKRMIGQSARLIHGYSIRTGLAKRPNGSSKRKRAGRKTSPFPRW